MANKPGAVPGSFGRTSLRVAVINGGAVGNFTVAAPDGVKIKTTDNLVAVLYQKAGETTSPGNLTSEFTVTGTGTINNTGGTVTTSGRITVMWHSAQPETASGT